MRPDGSPSGLREGLTAGRRELGLYAAAGIVYVVIGVAFPEFMFSWIVAVGFLFLAASLPALVGLLRK